MTRFFSQLNHPVRHSVYIVDCSTAGIVEVDIIFALDESGSVGNADFIRSLRWITNVLRTFQ